MACVAMCQELQKSTVVLHKESTTHQDITSIDQKVVTTNWLHVIGMLHTTTEAGSTTQT